MNSILRFATVILAMGITLGMLERLLPDGGLRDAARASLGFVYLAAIVQNIAVLFYDWGV